MSEKVVESPHPVSEPALIKGLAYAIQAKSQGSPEMYGMKGANMTKEKTVVEQEVHQHSIEDLVRERTEELRRANEELQREIAERLQLEKTLRQSEALSRCIIDAIPDLILRITEDGTLLDRGHSRDIGLYLPRREATGSNISEVMPPEVSQQMLGAIAQAVQTNDTQVLEYSLPTDDEMRHYEARIVASEEAGILAIIRDITERANIDRTESECASMARHELRTSLTSIHASLGLLIGGAAGEMQPQVKRFVEIAHNNSERLVELVTHQ